MPVGLIIAEPWSCQPDWIQPPTSSLPRERSALVYPLGLPVSLDLLTSVSNREARILRDVEKDPFPCTRRTPRPFQRERPVGGSPALAARARGLVTV